MDIKGIQQLKLTANEYCYLLFMHEKAYNWPGWSIDMDKLVSLGYLNESDGELTSTGKSLFQKVVVDDKFVSEYRELFPKLLLPSGSYARVDAKDLKEALKKFFNKYNYSKEVVLKATQNYLEEYQAKGYMYMKNSYFFINKKGEPSTLAAYCEAIINAPEQQEEGPTYLGGSII